MCVICGEKTMVTVTGLKFDIQVKFNIQVIVMSLKLDS